jgi:hypothetical protein
VDHGIDAALFPFPGGAAGLGPDTDDELIGAGDAAFDVVATGAAVEGVIAQVVDEGVVASGADEVVVAFAAQERVVAFASFEVVGAGSGHERVIAGATEEDVVAGGGDKGVVAGVSVDAEADVDNGAGVVNGDVVIIGFGVDVDLGDVVGAEVEIALVDNDFELVPAVGEDAAEDDSVGGVGAVDAQDVRGVDPWGVGGGEELARLERLDDDVDHAPRTDPRIQIVHGCPRKRLERRRPERPVARPSSYKAELESSQSGMMENGVEMKKGELWGDLNDGLRAQKAGMVKC